MSASTGTAFRGQLSYARASVPRTAFGSAARWRCSLFDPLSTSSSSIAWASVQSAISSLLSWTCKPALEEIESDKDVSPREWEAEDASGVVGGGAEGLAPRELAPEFELVILKDDVADDGVLRPASSALGDAVRGAWRVPSPKCVRRLVDLTVPALRSPRLEREGVDVVARRTRRDGSLGPAPENDVELVVGAETSGAPGARDGRAADMAKQW